MIKRENNFDVFLDLDDPELLQTIRGRVKGQQDSWTDPVKSSSAQVRWLDFRRPGGDTDNNLSHGADCINVRI